MLEIRTINVDDRDEMTISNVVKPNLNSGWALAFALSPIMCILILAGEPDYTIRGVHD
jgi:hypothetical protein